MSELEPLSGELAELRDQLPRVDPPRGLTSRVWGRVAVSCAALPPVAGVAATTLAAKFGAWGIPLAIGALVAGATTGVVLERTVFAPNRAHVAAAPAPIPEPAPSVPILEPEPRVEEPAPRAAEPSAPPPSAGRPKAARTTPTGPAVSPFGGDERPLIEAARTALVKHEPLIALQHVSRHRQLFPSGQLGEERDSLEVQALMQVGRKGEAAAAARNFLKKFPESVFGPAVEAALLDASN